MPCPIVFAGINIPINIDMCNTFAVYFQIFATFGYKKVKNSEKIRQKNHIAAIWRQYDAMLVFIRWQSC